MKALRVLLPIIVLGVIALTPHAAYAASGATFFGPIVPPECHCDAKTNGVDSAPDFGCVLQTLENLMNFAVSIGVIIFVLVASYAGFLFMFSPLNSHNREMGRKVLTNAVVGLLITLSAWLIVDFVMKTLYNGQWGPWNSLLTDQNSKQCLEITQQGGGTQTGGNNGGVTAQPGGQTGGNNNGGGVQPTGNEAAVRSDLAAHGITVNKNACPAGVPYTQVSGGCTTVGGLTPTTIQQAKNMSAAWGGFQITGGNEAGHATHDGGNRFDATGGIGAHITSLPAATPAQIAASDIRAGSSGVYADSCGNTYFNEGDHWHVTVFSACSGI